MSRGKAPAIRVCTRADHPAKRHGHYGPGGRYWCSDFRSPLLSEDNGGHIERGWIVIFEKPEAPPVTAPTPAAGTGDGTEVIEAVLADHLPTAWDEASLAWLDATFCDCGAGPFGTADDEDEWRPLHRAHVAAAIRAALEGAGE